MEEKEISLEIKKPEIWILLAFLALVFVLEVLMTTSTPISFGDEGYHTRMAQWIGQKQEYPVWTPFEGTNLERASFARPPIFNILEGSFIFIFGFNELIIKLLTPFIVFLTGISVFILTKRIFNSKVALIAAIATVTIPALVTYSVTFYVDAFLTFNMAMFFLLFILALKESNQKYLILSGAFGAFALLTKITGLMVYAFAFFAFFYELIKERKKISDLFKKYWPLVAVMILIPSGWLIRNYYYYNNPICYSLPFVNLFSTKGCSIDQFQGKYQFPGINQQTGSNISVYDMAPEGILSYLDFAYGVLWFVMIAFFCGLAILFLKRDMINDLLLISLALFLIIFYMTTGRAEDTARYTLGWVPIIALVAAIWLGEVYDFVKKYQKYLALVVFIFVFVFSYQNLNSKLAVMGQVKQFSPLFFEACDWIKVNTPQNSLIMTIWAHRAVYNCQRNAAGDIADIAMSTDVNYTLSVAKELGITHLFIQKFSIGNSPMEEQYSIEFVQFLENNPDHFKVIFENGLSLQQCVQQSGCDGNILYQIVF